MHERASMLRNSALAHNVITFGASALRSRGSSVGMASRPREGFRSSAVTRDSLLLDTTRPTLGPTQPPIQWTPGVRRPGPEADNLPLLVPMLRISGAITTLHLCALIAGTRTAYILFSFTRATTYSLRLVRGIP
jgi:hypothetical protein